jgi:broad specificity phosphatase PhoE
LADPPPALTPSRPPLRLRRAASLVLVRHGESTWIAEGRFQGRLDPVLSALGKRQAELVGRRLAQRREGTPLPIPATTPLGIWHSPLRRAADTAAAIARHQPGSIAQHRSPGLTELAQGKWEGLLHSEVSAGWPHELERWRLNPTQAHAPGGEALLDAAGRVGTTIEEVMEALDWAGASASVGATSDVAGDMAALRRDPVPGYPSATPAGETPPEPWALLVAHDGIFRLILMTLLGVPYDRFWSFPFNLCAITVVSLQEGLATLRAHNLSEHLAPLTIEARAAEEARGERRGAL